MAPVPYPCHYERCDIQNPSLPQTTKRDFAFTLVESMQNCSNVLNTTMVRVDEELQMVRAILQSYNEEADSFLGLLKDAYRIIVPICPYIDWDALDRLQEARQRDLDEYSKFLQKWSRVLNRYTRQWQQFQGKLEIVTSCITQAEQRQSESNATVSLELQTSLNFLMGYMEIFLMVEVEGK